MDIVVATDGSEPAIAAARRSMDLQRLDAHVVLVMVIPAHEKGRCQEQGQLNGLLGPDRPY